jgi:hypothetical protein
MPEQAFEGLNAHPGAQPRRLVSLTDRIAGPFFRDLWFAAAFYGQDLK